MDDSGGGDPSSHCRALTHPCAQTVVGTCSVPDRNLHVLRLAKLRLLLASPSAQPFLCAVRPRQLRKPGWSRDQSRPPSLPLPQAV